MANKEAAARIKINKLLEAAGWGNWLMLSPGKSAAVGCL
jgi:hypothetical protein